MKIDIIDYTAAQLALLSEEQLREVEEAQLKKNKLMRELAEKLNISRSYVSRIEKSALEKIRYRMLRKQI